MQELLGTIVNIKYQDKKTGYTGLVLMSNEKKIFCKGKLQNLRKGTPLFLEGDYSIDEQDRIAFIFSSYKFCSTKVDITTSYIFGLNIEGLTLSKAREFAEYFPDIFDVIKEEKTPNSFECRCNKNLKPYAKSLYKRIKRTLTEYDVFNEVLQAGGNYANARLIVSKNGINSYKHLTENPYMVGFYAKMTFAACENIACKYNISPIFKGRALGAINYILKSIEDNGDSCTTKENFIKYAHKLLDTSMLGMIPVEYLWALILTEPYYVIENDYVYRKRTYDIEILLANNINRLNKIKAPLNYDEDVILNILNKNNMKLSSSQKDALSLLKTTGIKIITGGPGTGKTAITKLIINIFLTLNPKQEICLCAPTGCAAQNLAIKTLNNAETIHKALGIQPCAADSIRTTKKLSSKFYIIDEASMLDMELAATLFNAIPSGSLVIIIGDVNQLPSVGYGDVLNDLIIANIETYTLTETFRQNKDASVIIDNANKINKGLTNIEYNDYFEKYSFESEKEAIDACVTFAGEDDAQWQVLTPLRRFESGATQLSIKLQEKRTFDDAGIKFGGINYHVGDHILMLENNYQVGYYNGDTGIITGIDEDGVIVKFPSKDTLYIDSAYLDDMTLSYAMSVHKSQGAEYDNVIILLTKKSEMMSTKNLVYTAITRAKGRIIIIEQQGCLEKSILSKQRKRITGLVTHLNN